MILCALSFFGILKGDRSKLIPNEYFHFIRVFPYLFNKDTNFDTFLEFHRNWTKILSRCKPFSNNQCLVSLDYFHFSVIPSIAIRIWQINLINGVICKSVSATSHSLIKSPQNGFRSIRRSWIPIKQNRPINSFYLKSDFRCILSISFNYYFSLGLWNSNRHYFILPLTEIFSKSSHKIICSWLL